MLGLPLPIIKNIACNLASHSPVSNYKITFTAGLNAGLRGNMLDMALDYKKDIGGGECNYGEIGGEQSTSLFYDYRPWGSKFINCEYDPPVIDFELITDWPDPGYKQSPDGMWHDWKYEEGIIWYFNLTELLMGYEGDTITDVRVRITNNTTTNDFNANARGNWRRSDNVMEQLCDPFYARGGSLDRKITSEECGFLFNVKFVGTNPHETDPNSPGVGQPKFVHFEDGCDAFNTTYIARRDSEGNAEICITTLVIPVGKFNLNDLADATLKIKVKSYEEADQRPSTWTENYTWVTMYPYYEASQELRGFASWERLCELYDINPNMDCNCLYIGKLTVCDNCPSPEEGKLFISSSDHLLAFDKRKDYAYAAATKSDEPSLNITLTNLDYGVKRGLGYGLPDKSKNKWFGYDDYIQSGGFGIVELEATLLEHDNVTYEDALDEDRKEAIPVQSEADVIIFDCHTYYPNYEFPTSILGTFNYPIHSECNLSQECESKYQGRSNKFIFDSLYGCGYIKPICCKRSDFLKPYDDNLASFWQRKNVVSSRQKDVKWLVILSCGMMDNECSDANYGHIRERLSTLLNVYYKSASGFKEAISTDSCHKMIGDYAKTLHVLINTYGENPSEPCFTNADLWKSSADMTKDPSVAAFMETCCILCKDYFFLKYLGGSACGIAVDNGTPYSWHILRDPRSFFSRIWKWYDDDNVYKIVRHNISENPRVPKVK